MPIDTSYESLYSKLVLTLRPLYDFRAWLLLLVCFCFGMLVDPASTLGLAGYLSYVIGMWGAALMLTKILTPYIRMSACVRSALSGNTAASIVVLARVLLLICIAISIMAWGK